MVPCAVLVDVPPVQPPMEPPPPPEQLPPEYVVLVTVLVAVVEGSAPVAEPASVHVVATGVV